ncbi:GDSL-type esterase/lipase family protein [Sinanaerobacter chloroacetimidivorans]|jgi:acyl-CoA thioesterase-1|uniref:SGNH hydrolase-type esterase domain-containing protein n=1 Tax=Sinanaerobacter chloroacetimidivorans TaxID=2818044 RepID=A0A8J7VY28_9FIRM|nr:GDSL-type esterase/lipase family protein [Sinanaerobacter chloroacetimidivorans]MBR0596811.1 hypothetical protein [Sinanaerobacter chloroacetimidivorans]
MKIVWIGNSIVNGFPYKRSQCFVSLLRESLHYEMINKGENGDISPNILSRFQKDVISHKPDKVVIMTGTNDFMQEICTPAETLDYLKAMTSLSRANAITSVVLTPLPIEASMAAELWIPGVDYRLVNQKLELLRQYLLEWEKEEEMNDPEVKREAKVKIIDTQEYFRQFLAEKHRREYVRDGLHPTPLGHEAIARFLQGSPHILG